MRGAHKPGGAEINFWVPPKKRENSQHKHTIWTTATAIPTRTRGTLGMRLVRTTRMIRRSAYKQAPLSSCVPTHHTTFFVHYYFPHSLSALSHSHVHDCRPDSKQVLLALLEQVAANGADSLMIGCCSAELRVLVGDAAGM